jgi:RNA polymerase sigma-70 factor (sigma-E family)
VRLNHVTDGKGEELPSDGVTSGADVVAFCRRVYPSLLGGLTLHCRDRGVAEDVAQETMVRVWERWPAVRQAASPEAWAWRVALNLTTSRFRRRAAERRAHDRLHDRQPVSGDQPDEADRLAVRAAVADLPERQRAALVLRYYADLPVAAVAEALGCAEGTVKSLTHQAVAALRRQLAPEEIEAVEEVVGVG